MINSNIINYFWKIKPKSFWLICQIIKYRNKKYWKIGLSRLEHSRIWLSQRELQKIINYLRKNNLLKKIDMIRWNNNKFLCNIYELSNDFVNYLQTIKEFAKKQYLSIISNIEAIQSRFSYINKKNKIIFEKNWIKYIIQKKWKFKDKIYDCYNNKIVWINLFIN